MAIIKFGDLKRQRQFTELVSQLKVTNPFVEKFTLLFDQLILMPGIIGFLEEEIKRSDDDSIDILYLLYEKKSTKKQAPLVLDVTPYVELRMAAFRCNLLEFGIQSGVIDYPQDDRRVALEEILSSIEIEPGVAGQMNEMITKEMNTENMLAVIAYLAFFPKKEALYLIGSFIDKRFDELVILAAINAIAYFKFSETIVLLKNIDIDVMKSDVLTAALFNAYQKLYLGVPSIGP
jgi:hypothetical protein